MPAGNVPFDRWSQDCFGGHFIFIAFFPFPPSSPTEWPGAPKLMHGWLQHITESGLVYSEAFHIPNRQLETLWSPSPSLLFLFQIVNNINTAINTQRLIDKWFLTYLKTYLVCRKARCLLRNTGSLKNGITPGHPYYLPPTKLLNAHVAKQGALQMT